MRVKQTEFLLKLATCCTTNTLSFPEWCKTNLYIIDKINLACVGVNMSEMNILPAHDKILQRA